MSSVGNIRSAAGHDSNAIETQTLDCMLESLKRTRVKPRIMLGSGQLLTSQTAKYSVI